MVRIQNERRTKKLANTPCIRSPGTAISKLCMLDVTPSLQGQAGVKVWSAAAQASDGSAHLFRKMFFNEANTAGALDHPNIMKILGAGDEAGEPYIVMEFRVLCYMGFI